MKLSYLLIVVVALMATLLTGCAVHRYSMQYGINQEGGYVSSLGKPDANDSRVLWNEKAWSDSFWQAKARKLRIEAVNESLLTAAYVSGGPASGGDLQMGVVVNETGHSIQIRGRQKAICPRQADTLFLRPGHYVMVIDHLDASQRLLCTRSISFLVDGTRHNASLAGMGSYDWVEEVSY